MESTGGKKVSQFSATQIGAIENVGNRAIIRQQFKEEAGEVLQHLKGVHHCRKISHMQTYYPGTIDRLSQEKQEAHLTRSPAISTLPHSRAVAAAQNHSQFFSTMNSNIHQEHDINQRKRYYNREVGRKAAVDQVGLPCDWLCSIDLPGP